MNKPKMGIGFKIFGGFIILILIGVAIGYSGYFSLNRVIQASALSQKALEAKIKVLDARRYEKNYIMRKDEASFKDLMQALEELNQLSTQLKSMMDSSKDAEQIAEAEKIYKNAADTLKRLENEDAAVFERLQQTAGSISKLAVDESTAAARSIQESMLASNGMTLKDKARESIKDVITVAYNILKFCNEQGMPREDIFDILRSIHFQGDNYLIVIQTDMMVVVHGGDRNIEGKDFGGVQDKKSGKFFAKEMVESAVKKGDSYTEYFFTKPGMGDAVFPKVTYSKYYEPMGLVVSAGVYMDDVEMEIQITNNMLNEGLSRLQETEAIKSLTFEARLNALYYFVFNRDSEKVAESLARLKMLPTVTDDIKKLADDYQAQFNQRVGNSDKRTSTVDEIVRIARQAMGAAEGIEKTANDLFDSSTATGKTLMLVFIVLGAAGGLALAFLLTRGITKPVSRAIDGLMEASGQVASAAGQVASSSQNLAEGSSEQAAAIEETSSSLEEMASMTRQNAENAGQANILMGEANTIISKANATMQHLTMSMKEITTASEETQKIIKTIDEIAFQTNLLALNAAVEAARAGEAGAGFAVVADEVRNLALRAAEAARNTADLIEGTVKKIKEGAQIVARTNDEFTEVTHGVTKSGKLIEEIAAASHEQAQGIGQVNQAVSQMDKVVQQNAATAEESASASEEMNAQAEQMKEFVVELANLVGGNSKKVRAGQKAPSEPRQDKQASGMEAPCGARTASGRSGSVKHSEKGNGNGHGHTPLRSRDMRAEQLIPFDKDDFSDF
ncbi:methyl-accepting chemotaxis protein [Desulforhabdus sp. TSK]|uniref:methyl-accepting chemotaxis protein n=1 Tax=Desulforhabdus sp. TSK TaxID=2925014 RepID=UPI001FC856A4|nr:methyl-accepting chemotaxis protein [Desulforhabdus sp. TSK]GKT08822.1 hypothetical protein DSTSK_21270 [Desulforhabdus sp. TSK]